MMPSAICVIQASFLLLASFTSAPWAIGQTATQGPALTLPASKESVVRFFYQPSEGEHFHHALIFRVVGENDPRWNTVAYSNLGQTTYVSLSDMRRFIKTLAQLSLRWDESAKIESLEPDEHVHPDGYGMSVKVLSVKGTAKATIPPDRICVSLASLDNVLLTPRALWEFQGFQYNYHCDVPTWNRDAYTE